MSRRPAPAEPTASGPTFAELSRIRGEHDRADRAEAAIVRMFPQITAARG